MDTSISTPRLQLTVITAAERGSPEFEWVHQLRSDKQATWWSILPRSETPEDTEKAIQKILPTTNTSLEAHKDALNIDDERRKAHRVTFAVHEIRNDDDGCNSGQDHNQGRVQRQAEHPRPHETRFIGLVALVHVDADNLVLPEHLSPSASETSLILELSYSFLPDAWGKGYATESVNAVLAACGRCVSLWSPYAQVYVRAIVNGENRPSLRVMEKTAMVKKGVYELNDRPVFLAGKIRQHHVLHIYGMYLVDQTITQGTM
ncbi:hypothetical protein PV08_04013 [Exophiala spinifera]|uniref:N-acetyltransferase domain-containing protein n=1 Tax=Exophiala spinifera TaxID=91928 RepID=A0A0D2BCX9_9EURO|nr:uncharacterized protein PV08_04013 [Exophiala spinifera]KIW16823.1 hypothetical protein PV08_04013 [Exophiala spinifera]